MRMRLLQDPRLVKWEFDDAIRKNNPFCDFQRLEPIPEEVYQEELLRVANFTNQEREQIDIEVGDATGQTRQPGGGIYVSRVGFGDNCYAFAFDPETNGLILINDFGFHAYAKKFLAERIKRIEAMRKRDYFGGEEKDHYIENRFLSGLIVKVKSLQSPLLLLHDCYHVTEEQFDHAINFLKRQRRFIITDFDIKLTPGQLEQ